MFEESKSFDNDNINDDCDKGNEAVGGCCDW
jgi:hypothetical protein